MVTDMKKMISFALLGLLCTALTAAECRKHNQSYVAPTERGVPFLLKNNLTNYVITYRFTNASPTQVSSVLLGMPAPVNKYGFSRKDFTSITINGIDSRQLEPKKFDIFNTPEASGVDVHFNFNGIPMIQRFSVSDSSGLLTMSWRRGPGKAHDPIRTMTIRFFVMPCASGRDRDSYLREVVTPAGKYSSKPKVRWRKQALTRRDTWLILQDAKYQTAGPVLLCPDWGSIVSGQARFGAHQDMYLEFQLDPNANKWDFGMLDSEVRRKNADFADFLKKQKIIR